MRAEWVTYDLETKRVTLLDPAKIGKRAGLYPAVKYQDAVYIATFHVDAERVARGPSGTSQADKTGWVEIDNAANVVGEHWDRNEQAQI